MTNDLIKLGYLAVTEVDDQKVYKCSKCGYILCPITENYKNSALKMEAPISKGQPEYLASKSDKFILREYYCPQCGGMFEVDMVAKGEKEIWSVQFK
jgi:acetone carboxylase gamma subunit